MAIRKNSTCHEGYFRGPILGEIEFVVVIDRRLPFERAMVVSYRLSIVTIAISVAIRPQFAIDRMPATLKSTKGMGQFGSKCWGAPFGVGP